ncbi:hypothetical protein L1049_025629 [Liquidambar formosana]|uniref:Alginate lyase 2 domain-containing protein n=1 Tax=Liquidambar formosana TaxID=63359 RepID=A0AAP0ND64_LIQFO
MNIPSYYILLFVVLMSFFNDLRMLCGADPTDGFTPVPLTNSNFELQKPYNVPLDERYSYEDGVHRMWVYADDKPHDPNSYTQPRTEIRRSGLDYSSGVWQFEGYGYDAKWNKWSFNSADSIHGAAHDSSTIKLRIYNGDMRYYSGNVVATGLYDKYLRKFETKGRGQSDFYFKCGVYACASRYKLLHGIKVERHQNIQEVIDSEDFVG